MSRYETAVRRNVKSSLCDFTFHLGFLESGCPSMQSGKCTASPTSVWSRIFWGCSKILLICMGKAPNWCKKQANNVGRLEEKGGNEGNKWRKSAVTQPRHSVVNEWQVCLWLFSKGKKTRFLFMCAQIYMSKNIQMKLYSIIIHNFMGMDEKEKAVVFYQKSIFNKMVS